MPLDSFQNLQKTALDWLARPGDPLVAPAVPDMILMFEEEARDRLQTRFTEKTVTLPAPVSSGGVIPLPADYGELRSIWIETSRGRRHFQYQTPRNLDMNLWYLEGYPAAYTIEGLNLRIMGSPTSGPNGQSGSEVTLTPGAASTVYTDPQITPSAFIGLMPQTVNAADALSSIWIEPEVGFAIIHHASAPDADQTFAVTIAGGGPSSDAPGQVNLDYLSGIPPLSDANTTNWLLTQYPSAYLWGTLSYAAPYIGDDPRLQIWLSAREAAIERIRLADRRAKFPHGLMIQTDVRNP